MSLTSLRFAGQTGLTVYAVIRNEDSEVWNGSALETFNASNWATYDILMSEQSTSGFYVVDIPAALPLGEYHVAYHYRATASPLVTDEVVFQSVIQWNGESVVDDLSVGTSQAAICNMALGHLGVTREITNLTTDTGEEARVCRLYYNRALEYTLRKAPWPFAIRVVAPSLVDEDPTIEWAFSYRYPTNAVLIRRIPTGTRNPSLSGRVEFDIIGDDSGRLILCDVEEADMEIEYVKNVTDPSIYSPDFILAFSYLLAFYIAPKLSRGDRDGLGARAFQMWGMLVGEAQATFANEKQLPPPRDSDIIEARE